MKRTVLLAACWAALVAPRSDAQQLFFSQDFDVDETANWRIFDGPTDESADFFFDYSTIGIPTAPGSAGGTTRGMKLQANMTSGVFGGFNVSPTESPIPAQSTGSYKLEFDWWTNYIGSTTPVTGGLAVGGVGSTMVSTFGILSSGNAGNYPATNAVADGLYFAATGDGGSSADYRVYSPERPFSYASPAVDMIDQHVVYEAGSRNQTASYYTTHFSGQVAAPALQATNFPATQFGATPPGTLAFAWHNVVIEKSGSEVTWKVDNVLLATVDLTNMAVPFGGTNILFGYADTNSGTNAADESFPLLQFSLIDNIRLTGEVSDALDADFDGVNGVDGADVLIWQQAFEISNGLATNGEGDANGDGNVTAADLDAWASRFGGSQAALAAGAVPEPTSGALAALLLAIEWRGRRPRSAADARK